jgi:arylsulfatase A
MGHCRIIFLTWLCLAGFASAADPAVRTNIIVMLIDDMGASDLGCTGSKYHRTPHLDRMAAEGLRFTQAYSACTVCSPTRAALLTGQYPARLHLTDWITGHEMPKARLKIPSWTQELVPETRTIAEELKAAGYATASIGKWHLGAPGHKPEDHGFDQNIGGTHRGQPPSFFSPYKIETLPDGPVGESLTERLTTEAIQFIDRSSTAQKPFFIYFPHYAVHTPLQADKAVTARYEQLPMHNGQGNATYAAMVESVDHSVGRLTEELTRRGLAERTLFIFTSDNGGLNKTVSDKGWRHGPTDNSPHRLGKGSAYEGGVRVPMIVRWPGTVQPGRTSDVPVITMDLFPTLLAAASVTPSAPAVDGIDLMPILRGTTDPAPRDLFWHYPHYHPGSATPYSAILSQGWRYIEFHDGSPAELYHLPTDVGESENLALITQEKATHLRDRLHQWRTDVKAQMPTVNPAWKVPGQ